MNTLPNTLSEVRNFLYAIPNIKNGGCGIASLAMYRWCKTHDIPCEIVCLEDVEEDLEYNLQRLLKGITTGLFAPSHCGIDLGTGEVLDCEKTISSEYTYKVSEMELLDLLNNCSSFIRWNIDFVRSIWLSVISNNLGVDLSDVQKEN